jgi:O-antigen/teichoic acid export membrane protein
MNPDHYQPGEIDAGDPRWRHLPPEIAAALADREDLARAHRRAMHVTLWPSVITALCLGFLAGLAWSSGA